MALARSRPHLIHIWGDAVLTAENSPLALVFPFAREQEKGQRHSEHKRNPDLFATQTYSLDTEAKL